MMSFTLFLNILDATKFQLILLREAGALNLRTFYVMLSCYHFALSNLRCYCIGDGCSGCFSDTHLLIKEGGIPRPTDTSNPESPEGIRNENFVVWMRTAALSKFRKLFGRLTIKYLDPVTVETSDEPVTLSAVPKVASKSKDPSMDDIGFMEGDKITFRIIPNFVVSEFGGKKKLILSTYAPLSSNSRRVGKEFIIVGSICVFLAGLAGIKLRLRPRVFGDPHHLHLNPN